MNIFSVKEDKLAVKTHSDLSSLLQLFLFFSIFDVIVLILQHIYCFGSFVLLSV